MERGTVVQFGVIAAFNVMMAALMPPERRRYRYGILGIYTAKAVDSI